jgi:hypothetical protein
MFMDAQADCKLQADSKLKSIAAIVTSSLPLSHQEQQAD